MLASQRLRAVIAWSGASWVGSIPGLEGCRTRAATRAACLDRLLTLAGTRLKLPVVPLLIDEEPPALVGMSEAATILGWDRRKFATYVARGHVPMPIAELAGGRVWRRADIETFRSMKARRSARRSPGRGAGADTTRKRS
jgi:hypothetical protein